MDLPQVLQNQYQGDLISPELREQIQPKFHLNYPRIKISKQKNIKLSKLAPANLLRVNTRFQEYTHSQ